MSMRDVTIREAGVEITLSVPTSSAADSSSAAASPAPAAKRARADATCAVCALAAAKYTCPRCAVRSCSLACVRRHKRDTGCNGQRDKTAFVSIKQMNTNHLVSDLHFLEEVEHNSERARTHLVQRIDAHGDQVLAARAQVARCSSNGRVEGVEQLLDDFFFDAQTAERQLRHLPLARPVLVHHVHHAEQVYLRRAEAHGPFVSLSLARTLSLSVTLPLPGIW